MRILHRYKASAFIFTIAAIAIHCLTLSAHAATAPVAAEPRGAQPTITFSPDSRASEQDKKDIEKLLVTLEKDWNSHNLDGVMGHYADDYVNNDGFDRKVVTDLTRDFWKEYPDVKSASSTKQIRVEGPFATVESRDVTTGTSEKEIQGLGTKGELTSVSEGQLYLKRIGPNWRIIGDRIDFERVRVTYGLARQLDPIFAAPEQVKAGKQFSAKLEVELPPGLTAMGSITAAQVQYPPPRPPEAWKFMTDPASDHPLLERVMTANTKNRNELLMATIGVTNASRNSLMGIVILTRRLNVVPPMEDDGKKVVETTAEKPKAAGAPDKSDKPASDKPGDKPGDKAGEKSDKPGDKSDKAGDKSGKPAEKSGTTEKPSTPEKSE